jgi:hypothetical protein
LDEYLVTKSMTAMRMPVSFSAKEAVAVLPVMELAGMVDSMKGFVKPSTSMKGFLRQGFLNSIPAVKALTPKVKDVGVVGIPSPWVVLSLQLLERVMIPG